MYQNKIETISKNIINEFKTYEDRTSFVFMGYFRLYCELRINTKLDNFKNSMELLNYLFKVWEIKQNKKYIDRTINNYNVLGLETLKNISNNPNTEKFCNQILELKDFGIEDLIDLFELLSPSDKSLNDFFTPSDISKNISQILLKGSKKQLKDKKEIKICDPTCGVGRLLYHSFLDLKKQYPNKKIICLGNDIFPKYSVFTKSILDLVNFGNNQVYIGNGLYFNPKSDLIIGNPPFGNLPKHTYEEYVRVYHYCSKEPFPSKYKHLKPLNNKEYETIVNNFKVV